MSPSETKEIDLCSLLFKIDPQLVDIKISERISYASYIIVHEHIINKFPNLKEGYIYSEWYGEILQYVRDWYIEIYGVSNVVEKNPRLDLCGIISIYSALFLIQFPISVLGPGKSDGTKSFEIPVTVLESENPIGWIVNPPNIESWDQESINELVESIAKVASTMRSLRFNITSNLIVDDFNLKKSILYDIYTSVMCMVENQENFRRAFWYLHQAVEKTLKMCCLQSKEKFLHIHDLKKLYEYAEVGLTQKILCDLLAVIPPWNEILEMRYGRSLDYSIVDAFDCYNKVIAFIDDISMDFKRLVKRGPKMYIRLPRYMNKNLI